MPKIPSYDSLTTPNDNDLLVIEDMTAGNTKKVSLTDLPKGFPAESIAGAALIDGSVTANKVDFTTFTSTANQTSAITFPAGVTYSDSYLTKLSNMAIFTGFFQKSGNFATGDLVATLPAGYRPPGVFRAAAYATGTSIGRVEINTSGEVYVRNVSGAGNLVFQIVFPTL